MCASRNRAILTGSRMIGNRERSGCSMMGRRRGMIVSWFTSVWTSWYAPNSILESSDTFRI